MLWILTFLVVNQQLIPTQAVDWPTLAFTQIVTNTFTAPTTITSARDDSHRLFIVEQKGRVWIVQAEKTIEQPFLDIAARVASSGAEQGLLGIAFPHGFSTNRHFYVSYTRSNQNYTLSSQNALVISRFTLTTNENIANPASEEVLLVIPKVTNIHNGGELAFGSDGYLYIGIGDGGPEGDPGNIAQKTTSLLGKILRIDVEKGEFPYVVPSSNPFVGNPNFLPEIWSYGLRNPWRFSFDRASGDLFIGDVGQDLYEEIDFQSAASAGGENYGWRPMEGFQAPNDRLIGDFSDFGSLTLPVAAYNHIDLPGDSTGSVIGGYVYRGPHAARLDGIYFYGDFMNGFIWGLAKTDSGWTNLLLATSDGAGGRFRISAFGEDEAGHLLIADYYTGRILQLSDAGRACAPIFSSANGFISSDTLRVTNPTAGGQVHYTINGGDPSESDLVLPDDGRITIANGATVKARTFRSDLMPSDITTGTFVFKVATPVFTPPAASAFYPATGSLPTNMVVSITSETPGAIIYFTTNGLVLNTNSSIYNGPLALKINGSLTLRAFAHADGFADSAQASIRYTNAVALRPAFRPSGNLITNGTLLSMICFTPGAGIYFTLDGSIPTTNSVKYTSPFALNGETTVRAISVAPGYANSPIRTVIYSLPKTATPQFNPSSGPVAFGTTVSISEATTNAVIYFTTNGSTPTTNSTVYSGPLTITNAVFLQAFALAPEHANSDVLSVNFHLIQTATPVFSPNLRMVTNGANISISSETPGSTIYYTMDGSLPDTNSTVYTTPIPFTGPFTLNAQAFAPRFDPSAITTTFYGLLNPVASVVTTVAGEPGSGYVDGPLSVARFSRPEGVCLDATGNLYVADTGNNAIRKITPAGVVSTIGVAAGFLAPTSVLADNDGNIYVADGGNCNRVVKIATDDETSVVANVTLCGVGIGNYAPGLWQMNTGPDNDIYIGYFASVRRIAQDGTIATLAGPACNCGGGWSLNVAPFVDSFTNIYSATGNYLWITTPTGSTDLFSGGDKQLTDGSRLSAGYISLQAVVGGASNSLILSDYARIRILKNDVVSTIAGDGENGYKNGSGAIAQFNGAAGICVDTNQNIYVADSLNNCIRKVSPDTASIGIADDWQIAHFGHVGIDPSADPDHDGMSNYSEFRAGTDPNDAGSILAIDRAESITDGQIRIRWTTISGKVYTVEYSRDLTSWTEVGEQIRGDGSVANVNDSFTSDANARFYRILVEP